MGTIYVHQNKIRIYEGYYLLFHHLANNVKQSS